MSLLLIRIDDRLIHGQVIEGWARALQIETIVVVSDCIAEDPFQRRLLQMAVPGYIKVSVISTVSASNRIKNREYDSENTMFLFSSPKEALDFASGLDVKNVNLGGLHYRQGKVQVMNALSLGEEDISALKALAKLGIDIEYRVLPTDEKISLDKILLKYRELAKKGLADA